MTLDYISDKESYENQKSRFLTLFTDKLDFHENVFRKEFKYFLAFEFDFIHHPNFFEGLKYYLKFQKLNCFTYFTMKPSPEKYFYKHFKKYSIGLIPRETTDVELNEFLMRNPGSSPADALAINSQEIALFSESDNWGIVASKDLEIGLIGLISKEERTAFLSSFGVDTDMFMEVKDQVEILNEIISFNETQKLRYLSLIENCKNSD